MNSQELPSELFAEAKHREGINVDFKRVLFRVIKYWYVIVISLAIAFATAFLINRYATRIYPVTSSILIKEAGDITGGELLYNNPLVSYKRNYLNELYIIKSHPLISSVIKELNFEVAFYREGNFLTSDAYDYMPVTAEVFDEGGRGARRLSFRILSEREYELSKSQTNGGGPDTQVFAFGDTIAYSGLRLHVRVKSTQDLAKYIDVPFILSYTPASKLTGTYVNALNAAWAERGAGIINLSLHGPNPKKNIDFLIGLIRRYQEYDLEKKNQTATRTVNFISEQLASISDSLRNVEQQLEIFKDKNVVTDLTGEALRLYQKIEALEAQKATFLINRNYYDYLEGYLKNGQNLEQIVLPSSVGITDPILTGLISKMVDAQLELKTLRSRENPLAVEAQRGIDAIRADIATALTNLKSTDKIKLDFIDKQISAVENQLGYLPVAERRLISIQRNYTLLENLYIFLLQKSSEAAISKAANTSDIVLVNPPMAAGAIAPKISQNYIIAGLLGLSLPVLLFVLLEVTNTKVQSKEDIEKMTNMPFIGGVGHNSSGNNLIVREKPKSGVAESFRALRSNLNFFTGNKTKQVFMVSSSISGEGKTFTTVNLATVFALSGKRTLIVGADMRRPKISEDFKRDNSVGLSTYLSGLSEFSEVVRDTEIENLFLVSGGPVPPNPSELLLTDEFEAFIKNALEEFEYVIIDTPPLALVTDAFVISKYVDHTVFVLRQNYSPKEFVRSIDEYYKSGKLKNMSILLNDIYKSGLGYGYGQGYAYHYGYGYGYGRKKNGQGYYEDQ